MYILVALLLAGHEAGAQDSDTGMASSGGIVVELPPVATYREAVAFALDYNPAVVSAYYQYEAAREAHRSSQGLFYPSVDLAADYGWEDRTEPDLGDYERESVRFSVTQLLFDGFQARDQARALGYEELSQYYNFHDAAQEVALEVTDIYATTVLYSELVKFAEQNYVAHRQVYNMIQERSEGQLDPTVDLEQATARLALAESNLLSEISNLFETQVEFQRVVGLLPAEELEQPEIPAEVIPALRSEALRLAFQKSPEINREIEDLRSAREELNATRGPLYPRLDLRYRNEYGNNISGFANDAGAGVIQGDYEFQAIELLLTYNLYRGGADSARRREYAARYYAALEDRKDACLGIRQQVSIIFNNLRVLKQQVVYLTTQLEAQDNTRRAYKDQFQIGQRSLLDLLDSQNEFFDTQRALVTAEVNLVKAQAAILAETGVLTDAVGARGFNAQKIDELKLDLARRDNEEIPPCAFESVPEVAADQKVNFERLDAEAEESDFMR